MDLLGKLLGKRTFRGELRVFSPTGKKILSFPLRKAEEQLVFSAPETGIYLLTGDTAGNEYQLFSPHPGQGYVAEQLGFCHSRGRLYFEVPPNVADIRIEVKGDRNESITARLRDSRNKVVQEVRTKEKPVQLRHSRTYPERRELWSVEIVKMVEDGSLSLGLPLNPVFSPYPEALLRHE